MPQEYPPGKPLRPIEADCNPPDRARTSRVLLQPATGPAVRFLQKTVDAILPSQCLGCAVVLETADTICHSCWGAVQFIGASCCQGCGLPFSFDQPASLCGECIRYTPPFARARSAVVYDHGSRELILAFKHGDRPEAARLFAQWMVACAPDLIADADLIVPVPLYRKRLFQRRYNQAALIVRSISRLTGTPHMVDGVERTRDTKSQGHMTAVQRRRNVSGAFAVPACRKNRMSGKRILLIDDVYTSGATVSSVARTLNRAGVKAVDVLTVARVVREQGRSRSWLTTS